MALVLGMEEGQSVFIDKDRVVLKEIVTPNRFKLLVETPTMDHIYEISESERVEIFPDVYVQAGRGGNMQVVKIAIEAHPSKLILREKVMQRNEADAR